MRKRKGKLCTYNVHDVKFFEKRILIYILLQKFFNFLGFLPFSFFSTGFLPSRFFFINVCSRGDVGGFCYDIIQRFFVLGTEN